MSATRNKGLRRQRGIGMTGLMLIMSVSIFVGMFIFKVGPHYFENWTVTKIAEDVSNNSELMKKPRTQVYQYINQAYRTNNLWDLKAEETIKLKKDSKLGYQVTVQYEKRAKLFHNIDLITTFGDAPGDVTE